MEAHLSKFRIYFKLGSWIFNLKILDMICRLLFGILSLCIRNQQVIRVFLL